MRMRAALASVPLIAALGCDVPTPLAPAEPIGTPPNWGADFATPSQQPTSLLAMGSAGAPTLGNTGMPAGSQSPGATGDWSGGDAEVGKAMWGALCARCHGESGEGGAVPGGAKVPSLADAAWQSSVGDRQIARSIMLGKGAMPSFMSQGLDRPKLAGLVAYIRSLKR